MLNLFFAFKKGGGKERKENCLFILIYVICIFNDTFVMLMMIIMLNVINVL